MPRLSEKGPLYLELYDAVAHFLGRQQLVVRAVLDQGVVIEALTRGVAGWYDKTPQRGRWGEWEFMFHGGGCTLMRPSTQEVITWNGPDPLSFDPYFFLDHLQWRFRQGAALLPHLRSFIEKNGPPRVVELLQDLMDDGIISSDYRLINEPDSSQASAA